MHIQLAVAYYRNGEVQKAIHTFDRAKSQFPQSADVHNYYGEILLDQQRFEDAEAHFKTGKASCMHIVGHTESVKLTRVRHFRFLGGMRSVVAGTG